MKNWIRKGNIIYIVPSERWYKPFQATISKVGREYFHTTCKRRYRIDDCIYDDGKYCGESKAYESLEAYNHEENIKAIKRDIVKHIDCLSDTTILALKDEIVNSTNP